MKDETKEIWRELLIEVLLFVKPLKTNLGIPYIFWAFFIYGNILIVILGIIGIYQRHS